MDFGVSLPAHAGSDAPARIAQAAEAAHFDSAFVSDHIVMFDDMDSKYPYSKTGDFPLPAQKPGATTGGCPCKEFW